MSGVTLSDLKFIEDPKHRKAFLIALREVEEEGFDALSLEESVRKMKGLEKAHVVHKEKQTVMDNALKAIGSSPRERASSSMIKKRKFTHTNAVDLKDYKYWRDPNFDKKQNPTPKSPFSTSFDDSFESVFKRREELSPVSSRPEPKFKSTQNASKPKSLYDELFADIIKDHEPVKTKEKTQSYKDVERIIDGTDEVKIVNPYQKTHVNRYNNPAYAKSVKERVEKFHAIQKEKQLAEEEVKREIARKKLQAEKVEREAALVEDELNKGKTKKSDKLTVEIIGVDEKPKATTKKTQTKKSTTASTQNKTSNKSTTTKSTAKPRKRKKKLDADIKLYRNIHID